MPLSDRRFSRRAVLRTGALGVGALLAAACGQSAPPASAPKSEAGAKPSGAAPAGAPAATTAAAPARPAASTSTTRLVFWRHQYDPTDKVNREIIFPDALAKLGLEFDYQIQRDDDYKTKMLPQLASGVGPDIFEATEAFRVKFAKAGVYAPVDYTPWGGKEKWESFWEKGVVDALRIDGKDFNVPLEWTAIPVNYFVNSRHAEEAGIGADIAKFQKTPISWAELGPWAAKMTKRDASGQIARDGFMIQHGYGPDRTFAFWEPYFRQAGGKMLSDDGKKSLLNSEAGIAALQNLSNYVFKDGASMLRPQDKESGSAKLPKEETSSTTGMSQWAYGTFKQLAPDKWQDIRSLLAPQVDPGKPRYDSGPGWSYGVFAKSPNREAAFKYLHFAAAEHGSDLFDGGIVPPVTGWTEKYPGLKKLADAEVWTRLSREATPLIRSEAELLTGVQRSEGFQRAFEAVMFNKADVKAELDRWNKDVQEALDNL
ncbi:MAG: extracellular solute-binding protein [Chloroflexi bacterium]|nr:extracellular solute-binding protein [Chloroflexota bacterium]